MITDGQASRWKLIFATDAVEERSRFDAYREQFSIPYGVEVSSPGPHSFQVKVWQQDVGSLSCAKFRTTPTLFSRGSSQLRDGDDSILLLMATSGDLNVWQRDTRHSLWPGDIAIQCNGEERGGSVDGEGFAVQFSRASLSDLLGPGVEIAPALMTRDAAKTKLLAGYLGSFMELPAIEQDRVNDAISRHVLELLALALGPSHDTREMARRGGVRAARLHAIKAYVRAGVGVRDLSVTATASHHGVTPRYVQMLFEREGTTYSEFVLAERLLAAFRLLSDPATMHTRVSEIAYAVGFSDLSYFNRTFRRRFGATPSDIKGRE